MRVFCYQYCLSSLSHLFYLLHLSHPIHPIHLIHPLPPVHLPLFVFITVTEYITPSTIHRGKLLVLLFLTASSYFILWASFDIFLRFHQLPVQVYSLNCCCLRSNHHNSKNPADFNSLRRCQVRRPREGPSSLTSHPCRPSLRHHRYSEYAW